MMETKTTIPHNDESESDCEQAQKLCESNLLIDTLDDKIKVEKLREGGY